MISNAKHNPSDGNELLRECAETLQCVANYHLPLAIDRRLQWLAENKEQLSESEREELLALSEFTEQRTLEKVRSQVLLKRIAAATSSAIPT